MIAHVGELLRDARSRGVGIASFNVIGLEHAEAVVLGAELENSPVIMQISQNAVAYRLGQLAPIAAACAALASQATVPVGLHADHLTTMDMVKAALDCGFRSFMFDAADCEWDENVSRTRAAAEFAHERGAVVEAELGFVGGKDGTISSEDSFTNPEQAAEYVGLTGVDSLAVAIGSEHGAAHAQDALDIDRLKLIREQVNVPLVLHGSSGVSESALRDAVANGITKVNIATVLNIAFTGAVREYLASYPVATDPRTYGAVGRAAMIETVRTYCRLVAGKD